MSAIPLHVLDFDASDGALVEQGATGQWEWGLPSTGPGPLANVWGTRLHAAYVNDAVDLLEVALPDLVATTRPTLVLRHWYDVQAGDGGTLWVSDGTTWSLAAPVDGYPSITGFSGRSTGVETSAWTLPRDAVAARLVFRSDATGSAPGWYLFGLEVWDGDVTPPNIAMLAIPEDATDPSGPFPVTAEVTDDVAVLRVDVAYAWDGSPMGTIEATGSGPVYTAALPGAPLGTRVTWALTATDGAQAARWPPVGNASFRVHLPAPRNLHAPDPRLVGHVVRLAWDPPDSDVPILGYRVDELGGDDASVDVELPFADLPVRTPGEHTWIVGARHADGYGDASEPFVGEVEIPRLVDVSPAELRAGDHLRLHVTTTSAYLHADATRVAIDGVVVERLTVQDVDNAVIDVRVPEDVTPGTRDLVVLGSFGESVFRDAIAVSDAAHPDVIVDPARVDQGYAGPLTLTAAAPFAAAPLVDAGADVVIASTSFDGDVATVEITVAGDATPGVRTLVLDDGERFLTARLTVAERPVATQRSCATTAGPPWAAALAISWGWRRSSRRARSR